IDAATIEALEQPVDSTVIPIGIATTTRAGRFHYVVRAGRNRDIEFRYVGSRRIGAATSYFRLRVAGTTSLEVNRSTVRNGESVLFSGEVRGQPIPSVGK